jgi:apolipoprotein N-acyltransferase
LNYLLALASAALLSLIFPGPDIVWLAPVALTPLLIAAAREPKAWKRFLQGWVAGIVFWFGTCYWIQFVLEVHADMGRWGGWGTFLLFCVLKAIHLGLFTLFAGYLMTRWYAIPAVAALWVGLERTHGTFGFAWQTLGNAGIDMPLPLRLAPYVGVYGLSFVFAMLATAVALLILGRRRKREYAWLLALGIVFLLPPIPRRAPGTDTAVVLQPNIDEEADWNTDSLGALEQHDSVESIQYALEPGKPPAHIVIWPEAPAPFYYYTDPGFQQSATNLARITHAWFLFGTVAFNRNGSPLNSAVLLAPNGQLVDRYDKMYLVPFGEFVPPLFSFVNRVSKQTGDFAPGTRVVVSPFGKHRLGTFICYESAFPHLVRQFARNGADILVNISNDGYFGHSAAREQHLGLVRMRAVENRRWIVRATNDGITAVVDPGGRIVARLPLYKDMAARVRFGYVEQTTPYTRHGDWFAWGSLCAAFALSVLAVAPRYRRGIRQTK